MACAAKRGTAKCVCNCIPAWKGRFPTWVRIGLSTQTLIHTRSKTLSEGRNPPLQPLPPLLDTFQNVDVLKPLQQTGDLSPTGLEVVKSLRTASRKSRNTSLPGHRCCQWSGWSPRTATQKRSPGLEFTRHTRDLAGKRWHLLKNRMAFWNMISWAFDMVPNIAISLKHWWYPHAQQAIFCTSPKGPGQRTYDLQRPKAGQHLSQNASKLSLAHSKLTKISRQKQIQSAPVLHHAHLGVCTFWALDYWRVFNLMISISQMLILNDIRIPPSPYPSTNPISNSSCSWSSPISTPLAKSKSRT